jgi:hypothetical protein
LVWAKEVDSVKFIEKRRFSVFLLIFSNARKLIIRNRFWLWYFLSKNKHTSISKHRIFTEEKKKEYSEFKVFANDEGTGSFLYKY